MISKIFAAPQPRPSTRWSIFSARRASPWSRPYDPRRPSFDTSPKVKAIQNRLANPPVGTIFACPLLRDSSRTFAGIGGFPETETEMPQIFHPSANTLSRLTLFAMAVGPFGLLILTYLLIRSPYQTQVRVIREQPVPFSHEHHVQGLGIDCRYCHTTVETSAFAGLPPTYTCMSCHSQIWSGSPMLEPVRAV